MNAPDVKLSLKVTWPILIALVTQTALGIWWASGISADVRYLKDASRKRDHQIEVIQSNRYTSGDAVRDLSRVAEQITKLERRLYRLEERWLAKKSGLITSSHPVLTEPIYIED